MSVPGDTFTLKQINHFTILSLPFLTNFFKKENIQTEI